MCVAVLVPYYLCFVCCEIGNPCLSPCCEQSSDSGQSIESRAIQLSLVGEKYSPAIQLATTDQRFTTSIKCIFMVQVSLRVASRGRAMLCTILVCDADWRTLSSFAYRVRKDNTHINFDESRKKTLEGRSQKKNPLEVFDHQIYQKLVTDGVGVSFDAQ